MLIPEVAWQGKVLVISVPSNEGTPIFKGEFLGREFAFFKGENGLKGIVGIPLEQRPGYYDLKLVGADKPEQSYKIKIKAVQFPRVSFWLKPAKKKLMTRDIIAEEWALIEKKLVIEDTSQRWKGKFIMPVKAPQSMVFGTVERINGKPTGRHRGLDLAAPNGTKIAAPNDGTVVFAEKLKAFGGTMVIDHGQGIHTLYFHLSKFMAKAGAEIEKGEVIALSGNSGISSGPHLHWGISVHNLRVDPMQWVNNEI